VSVEQVVFYLTACSATANEADAYSDDCSWEFWVFNDHVTEYECPI